MLTFFAVVNSGVAIVCAIFYYFLYAVTFNTDLLFDVHIHGNISKNKAVRALWSSG